MNKLWIRLSIAFGVVVLIAFFLLVATAVTISFNEEPRQPPENVTKTEIVQGLAGFILTVATIGSVVGIAAGVWMSRSLTAPLRQLEEAAHRIGKNEFSQRVEVRGTEELTAVAQAFNQMAADLEHAEELRRNLVADVAHELRTPLTILQGNLRAILDDVYPLNKEEVAMIYDQTRHLGRLVNDLHELAQAEAHQLPLHCEAVDMTQLVRETVVAFAPLAEAEEVELDTDMADNVPLVAIDSARIRQVLVNLLSNAIRHTPRHGRVTVRVDTAVSHLLVTVQDTGDGIAAEHLPHVFDRFYRSDPNRSRETGGTGLGLAIARAIVEAHHGQITVASDGAKQGSTFTLSLPV